MTNTQSIFGYWNLEIDDYLVIGIWYLEFDSLKLNREECYG